MLLTTTSHLSNKTVIEYKGIVGGEVILGANIFRDFFAGIRDIIGGRSRAYEHVLRKAKEEALREMQQSAEQLGANTIMGIDIDYEMIGQGMLMVSVSGTAVITE